MIVSTRLAVPQKVPGCPWAPRGPHSHCYRNDQRHYPHPHSVLTADRELATGLAISTRFPLPCRTKPQTRTTTPFVSSHAIGPGADWRSSKNHYAVPGLPSRAKCLRERLTPRVTNCSWRDGRNIEVRRNGPVALVASAAARKQSS